MRQGWWTPLSPIYLVAVVSSLLLSGWISINEKVINPDAICYLLSAQTIGQSGLAAAMHLCGQAMWPFYSILIHALATITPLSYTAAANVLDAIFTAISVSMFVAIVQQLGGSIRILWLAVFIILMAHDFNSIRQYIVRDHGYFAFYLISVWLLMRYLTTPRLSLALLWSITLLIAGLFRVEGLIFLFLLPFLAFFNFECSVGVRLKYFLSLSLLVLTISFVVVNWIMWHPQQALAKLGRLPELISQLQHGLSLVSERFENTKNAMIQFVLPNEAARDAGFILIASLIALYFISLISNLSWLYTALALYGSSWHLRFPAAGRLVLSGYLLIKFLVTSSFFAKNLFLSRRYLEAFSLTLMLYVPFALSSLQTKLKGKGKRILLFIIYIFMLSGIYSSLFQTGTNKTYLREAGDWLASNVPASARLYVNDIQIMYYSNHFGNDVFVREREWHSLSTIAQGGFKHYDYLALRLDRNITPAVSSLLEEIQKQPIKVFINKRGDAVYIYNLSHSEK